MKPYQQKFVDFLVSSGALTFGDFVTKSGRKTPYFINTGNFNSGTSISRLGGFYAEHIVGLGLSRVHSIFGPAYKGIPLCVATCSALALNHQVDIGFTFDRKEAKDHGDGGILVGRKIASGDSVVIVEDVITAGTTLKKIVPFIRNELKAEVAGVIISVDRCERGSSAFSAVQEARQELKVDVHPLVTVHDIIEHLASGLAVRNPLTAELSQKIASYLKEYGAAA